MSIQIIIDNPGIMAPGDTVTGKLICTLHSRELIRGIKCRFRGEEKTHWDQQRGKHRVRYTGKNTIISANDTFIGEGRMYPGRYKYQFAYSLPPDGIPSSFTHEFFSIRYYIEAVVDRPFAFDYENEITIHVVAPVSLVREQNMLPLMHQAEERLGCLCCISGPISLDLILEKDTYSLGETINFKIQLVNKSDQRVEGLDVKLLRIIELKSVKPSERSKVLNDPIATCNKLGVRPKKEQIYDISLKIPDSTIVHDFSRCTLFRQCFEIKVTAVLPIFRSNLTLKTNIKIGSTITETTSQTESTATTTNHHQQPSTNTFLPVPFVPVGEAPPVEIEQLPPSYDDVIKQRI